MNRSQRENFLTGMFAVWLAIERGRDSHVPTAADKKSAKTIAGAACDHFDYWNQMGIGGRKGLANMEPDKREDALARASAERAEVGLT
jgi:hypothetical protein